jgi:adhesin transport system membrane fusion protein
MNNNKPSNNTPAGFEGGEGGVAVSSGARLYEVNPDLIPQNSSASRTGLIAAAAILLLAALGWASVADIDQVARGSAQIIASSKTQVVQAPDGGVISELLVHEGDAVTGGQLLAKLDTARVEAAFKEIESKRSSLRATVIRLKAEMLNQPLSFPAELKPYPDIVAAQTTLYQRRRAALNEELAALNNSLVITRQELAMNEALLASGDVSQTEVLRLRRQVNETQGAITNRRNKYFQDSQTELAKAEEDLAGAEQNANQRKANLDYTLITAPVSGVIKNVRFTTQGAVLRPGDELLTIVPGDEALIVEAKIKPADIGFVRKGQTANVKIDAYDYTVFGSLAGEVIYISADTLIDENNRSSPEQQTYYRVHVQTQGRSFKNRPDENIELLPGMTATVELKTGKNTVLKYLLKPIVKTLDQSMSER